MKKIFEIAAPVVVVLSALLLAAPARAEHAKRYSVKSAMVTYLVTTSIGAMKIEHKTVLTFDDYGAKQREDTYENDVWTESTIDNGKTTYKLMHAQKEVYDLGPGLNLIDYTCDWAAIPDSFKVAGYAREMPPTTVAGQVCASFQVAGNAQGGITTYATWNRVCLLRAAEAEKSSKVVKATAIDELTPIAPGMFDIPPGYRLVRP